MSLATITAAALPPQAYAHSTDHDVQLTANPANWRAIRNIGRGWVKPFGGGLWTSPVLGTRADGTPTDSAWLEWRRTNLEADTSEALLTEVWPVGSARLLLIDDQAHLAAIVDAYPADDGSRYPDWEALATDGWDGVYLTDRGQWATRLPRSGPDLYGWDLESCLWLRPSYVVGRTVCSSARSEAGAA
ncbi:hypothetical protein ACIQFU_22850 [Streptomyces sp. NPDC093065]|uniref:hypothetical protein n=1 Tax=Streptomyces sp. NPDC093065 TaxID=3366021 RepID=UPI00381CCE98